MTRLELVTAVARHFATDEILKYVDADGRRNGLPATPVVDMIIRIVTAAFDAHDDPADDLGLMSAVVGGLARVADSLQTCVGPLFIEALRMERGIEIASPSNAVAAFEDASTPAETKEAYIELLKLNDVLIRRFGFRSVRMPEGGDSLHEEVKALGNVVAFFEERRQKLRHVLHPVGPNGLNGATMAESDADRADAALAHYNCHLIAGLDDCPENWSLRDCPDELRVTIHCLLSDLRHLADKAELRWAELLKNADAQYEYELAGDRADLERRGA